MSLARPPVSKPVLLRQLGLGSALALVISNMVGTGIFTTTGFLAGQLGSPRLVLGIWLAGAAIAMLGALCYSELAVNMPGSGGEYVYLTRAFGPVWGFITGWVSFFAGFSGPIAAAALAFSGYAGHFFPFFDPDRGLVVVGSGDWTVRIGGAQLLAVSLVAALTLLNVTGVARTARVQNALTAFKLAMLVAFIVFGFAWGHGTAANFHLTAVRNVPTSVPAQFAISLFWIYVAYSGWNAATYVAEELRDPARTLPLALGLGTAIVAVLYLALNALFLYAAPLEDLKDKFAVGSYAASRLFGENVAGVFSALMALALISTVNAMVTIGPRVYHAMARDGAFPAFAARIHPRWNTPAPAIVAQGVCAALMTFTPFPQLVVYIGFLLNFCAVLSVVALVLFRRRPGWKKLAAVDFAYPAVPALFLLAGLWVIVQGAQLKPWISAAAVATVAVGAVLYRRTASARGLN